MYCQVLSNDPLPEKFFLKLRVAFVRLKKSILPPKLRVRIFWVFLFLRINGKEHEKKTKENKILKFIALSQLEANFFSAADVLNGVNRIMFFTCLEDSN